ncbi:MAG TPA: TonB-dependent receptor, partial [Methylophilaceae bacterium]|nr:TonB-dependent receptor [Methylophilaceae bacterium]
MTERKNAQRNRANAFNGNPNDPRRYFKTKPISLIGASCMLLCAQAFAQGAEEQTKVLQPAIVQSRPLDLNVSQGILLAAATDDQNGVSGSSAVDPNTLPGIDEADLKLKAINVRAKRFYEVGPLPGLGLTREEIPGNIQSITAEDIKNSNALGITDLLNSKLQSINVNDYQGNPFQMDVTYRGFTAGPQIGTPQGLAVFFDGIRVNEPFGDVVNWDMIPMNALAGLDVIPGSNPIYGLGALGGAIAVKTKDGFNFTGTEAEVLTGSFGRKQLQASGGWNNGKVALFGAGSFFMEDGWRENSPSEVNQMFGKASYRGEKLDLNLSSLVVWNDLIGNGLLPSEMYKQNRNGVFTSPDTTDNRLWQFQLSGSYFVNDNFSITGQVYRRNSKRHNLGADVYTEFEGQQPLRQLAPGEEFTCLFNSTNKYDIPDYYLIDVPGGDIFADPNGTYFALLSFGTDDEAAYNFLDNAPQATLNGELDSPFPEFLDHLKANYDFYKNLQTTVIYPGKTESPGGPDMGYTNGNESAYTFNPYTFLTSTKSPGTPGHYLGLANTAYYYTDDGVKHILLFKKPINADKCQGDLGDDLKLPVRVDGAAANGTGPGVVEGTPTAVLTDSQIDQITDGAS